MTVSAALENLCGFHQPLLDALRQIDREGDENPDAAELIVAMNWISEQQSRSWHERFDAIGKVLKLDGKPVSLQRYLGWKETTH